MEDQEESSRRLMGMYASSKLRADTDGKLIEAVRARRVLYDFTNPKYMDNNLKFDMWKEIGEVLKSSPNACKARWNNIRDNYRKSLRRHPASTSGAQRYKYSNQLAFMNKFLKIRNQRDQRRTSEHSGDDEDDDGSENDNDNDDDDDDEFDKNDDEKERRDESKSEEINDPIKVDKGHVEQPETELMVDFEYFDKRESASTSSTFQAFPPTMHAVDAFLAGLSPTLKAMSPYHLSLAKAEIFAAVHKYEMKSIMEGGERRRDANPLS